MLPEVAEMYEESKYWAIMYEDGTIRTGLAGLAWYAQEFDDEAMWIEPTMI